MKIVCPHCQATYRIKSGVIGDAGANVTCKKCAGRFRVEVEAVSLVPSADGRGMVRAEKIEEPALSGPGVKGREDAAAKNTRIKSKRSRPKRVFQPGRWSLVMGALIIFILGAAFSYGAMTIFGSKPGGPTTAAGVHHPLETRPAPTSAGPSRPATTLTRSIQSPSPATGPRTNQTASNSPSSTGSSETSLLDPHLVTYDPIQGISGSLQSVGSDTLNNLMTFWAEGFRSYYPSVKIEIEGKGSSTAPPSLIAGTAQFGPMSREMKPKEMDAFEEKFGYEPSRVRVAVDALAVFVHKDNPIACLSLEQLDAIFSKTRKSGREREISTWGDLGLKGEWTNKPISLYGRNSASGTYGYFKKVALFSGDYKDSVKEQPGSSAVIQAIATDKYAIGYSGVGYKTADVRTVPLSVKGDACYEANGTNAYNGDYPLARFLYIYLNYKPNTKLDPLRAAFIRYTLSQEGQQTVIKDGFFPVSQSLVSQDLKALELE